MLRLLTAIGVTILHATVPHKACLVGRVVDEAVRISENRLVVVRPEFRFPLKFFLPWKNSNPMSISSGWLKRWVVLRSTLGGGGPKRGGGGGGGGGKQKIQLTRMVQAAVLVVCLDRVLLAALTADFVGLAFLAGGGTGAAGLVVEEQKPSGQVSAAGVVSTHSEQDDPEARCRRLADCVLERVALCQLGV